MEDFDQFWQAYPRKIGKLAARKAFNKAIKNGATLTQLLAGIGLYLQYKPVYADYCHPATWLNAGRWMDEWVEPMLGVDITWGHVVRAEDWSTECLRLHRGICESRYEHAAWMQFGPLPCQQKRLQELA